MNFSKAAEDLIWQRAQRAATEELWPEGPTILGLLERFVDRSISAADLDSWLPLGDSNVQAVLSWYFMGAALRFSELLVVHERAALTAFAIASLALYPGKNPSETLKLLQEQPRPKLDGKDPLEGIHMLGAKAVEDWVEGGLDAEPPTSYLKQLKDILDRNIMPTAANPGGSATLFARLMDPNPSRPPSLVAQYRKYREQNKIHPREMEWEDSDLRKTFHELLEKGKGNIQVLKEALIVGQEALELAESIFGPDHPGIIECLSGLAQSHKLLGNFHEAERCYKRVLTIAERSLKQDHMKMHSALSSLGFFYKTTGHYANAKLFYERSIPLLEKQAEKDDFFDWFLKIERQHFAEVCKLMESASDS